MDVIYLVFRYAREVITTDHDSGPQRFSLLVYPKDLSKALVALAGDDLPVLYDLAWARLNEDAQFEEAA